jgi:MoaA/NifB/PqqE/SkfB family radical SAM enzyme
MSLKAWQRNLVRDKVLDYREALENYYIRDKPIIELPDGTRAFSLLSPPIGSAVGRRRLRYILDDLIGKGGAQASPGSVPATCRTPHFVTIAVTYDCQCACAHCSAATYQQDMRRHADQLTCDELKRCIGECIALGASSIVLTGGEPLLSPDVFELLASVDPRKAICTVYTNGEYLDAATVAALKRAGTYGVFVSLDFADPEKHDANRRRPGLFAKAVSGIRRCRDAGILTGISVCVTREKIQAGEMDALMELGRTLEVLEVCVFDVIPTGRLESASDCVLREAEFGWLRGFRERYNTSPAHPRIIHQTMLTSIAFPCTGEGCPAGIAQMHLRANGHVSPCDFTPHSFGDVRTEPLSGIWKRMTTSPLYARPSPRCRLSDVTFVETLKGGRQC